jgi:hypothetical protein
LNYCQPLYLNMFHELTASRGKGNLEWQRMAQAVLTSPSHTTTAKSNLKGDNKAEAGQALAKYTSNVSQGCQYAGMLLTLASLSCVHTTVDILRYWMRRKVREEGSDPWIDSWPKVPQNNMLSSTGRTMESCQFAKAATARICCSTKFDIGKSFYAQ